MANQEPTILIKKADGTTERVPLSSLQKTNNNKQGTTNNKQGTISKEQLARNKKQETGNHTQHSSKTHARKKKVSSVRSVPKVSDTIPSHDDLPVQATPHDLATTTPVNDFFVDLAKAHHWTADDHASPLEESFDAPAPPVPVSAPLPHSRYEDVQTIAAAVQFSIPEELDSRLHALIQSRIKDIRTDKQILVYAMRDVQHGGLGLDEQQAQALVETIHSELAVKRATDIPEPKHTILHTKKEITKSPSIGSQAVSPGGSRPMAKKQGTEVSITDIHPPKREDMTLGPVDEIQSMTLADFRRLSADPHSAVEVLREKIATIRQESYLEYLKAQHAWYKSPLYRTYLAYLGASLDKKQPLKEVLGSELTEDDISVIASFTESLRF